MLEGKPSSMLKKKEEKMWGCVGLISRGTGRKMILWRRGRRRGVLGWDLNLGPL